MVLCVNNGLLVKDNFINRHKRNACFVFSGHLLGPAHAGTYAIFLLLLFKRLLQRRPSQNLSLYVENSPGRRLLAQKQWCLLGGQK